MIYRAFLRRINAITFSVGCIMLSLHALPACYPIACGSFLSSGEPPLGTRLWSSLETYEIGEHFMADKLMQSRKTTIGFGHGLLCGLKTFPMCFSQMVSMYLSWYLINSVWKIRQKNIRCSFNISLGKTGSSLIPKYSVLLWFQQYDFKK